MRNSILLLCMALLITKWTSAQTEGVSERDEQITFSTGYGFDEFITFRSQIPTIGIGYSKKISRRLSWSANILSNYRRSLDVLFDRFRDSPVIGILALGASNIFMTEEEIKFLEERGVMSIPTQATIKSLAIPADVGLIYYPINGKQRKIGINLGIYMMYNSYNYFRDYLQIERVQWSGSPEPVELLSHISVPTEFRSISFGSLMRIMYEFHYKNTALGIRGASYNLIYIGDSRLFSNNLALTELSLFVNVKLKK